MYFVYNQFLNCHAPFSRIQLLAVCNHNIWFSIFAENLVTRIIPWVWTDWQLQVDPSEHFHKIYFQGRSISLKIDFGQFGASKYLDELRLWTLSQTLDILASSETQLDNTFTDSPVSTQGYSLVRSDRINEPEKSVTSGMSHIGCSEHSLFILHNSRLI